MHPALDLVRDLKTKTTNTVSNKGKIAVYVVTVWCFVLLLRLSKSASPMSPDFNSSQLGSKHNMISNRNQMILLIIVGMGYVYGRVLYLAYALEQ